MHVLGEQITGPSKSFLYLLILVQLKKAKANQLELNNRTLPLMFSSFTDLEIF